MHNLTLDEAKALLTQCDLFILKDSAFGDAEYQWLLGNKLPRLTIAVGYSSSSKEPTVSFCNFEETFADKSARELFKCYKRLKVESNN